MSVLANHVDRCHAHRAKAPSTGDARADAGLLAASVYGMADVMSRPVLVNVAALALAMDRLTVHRISTGAARLVHETDLHTLPGAPPRLLRSGAIITVRDPERETLFGDTVELGVYPVSDTIHIIGLQYPDGANHVSWSPTWQEQDLQAGMPPPDDSPLIADREGHTEWTQQAIRFLLILGIHLDAEGSPMETRDEPVRRRSRGRPRRGQTEWVTRRVYLGKASRAYARGDSSTGEDGTEGRIEATVTVRGHLKRQPYGPNRSLRRWVYVESYEARRWIAPRPLRIDIRGPS